MFLSTLFALALTFVTVSARGRGGGGGGGGGGGTSSIRYTEEECYATYLAPSYALGNQTRANTTATKPPGSSYWYWITNDAYDIKSINYINTLTPVVNWQMEVLDAYYNGSFSVTLTSLSQNASAGCSELHSQVIPDAFFRVGPQSRGNVTRESYGDHNSYYFHFGRTLRDEKCPLTANKAFVNFESSNDNLGISQAWTLSQKKSGDKFELDGALTSSAANYNNFWNYVVNTTGTDQGYPIRCPTLFSIKTLLANTSAKMKATVSATEAKMDFEFTDTELNYTIKGTFTGQHWAAGPKLSFDKDTIQTQGEVPHVAKRAPKQSTFEKNQKWIVPVAVIFVLLVLGWILWHWFRAIWTLLTCCCCWPCCSRKARDRRALRKAEKEAKSFRRPHDLEGQQSVSYINKQPTQTVVPINEPQPSPTPTTVSYTVSPAIAESYAVTGGPYYVEIVNAQDELRKAHQDMHSARARGDGEGAGFAQTMVGHYSASIEHYMALRRAGM